MKSRVSTFRTSRRAAALIASVAIVATLTSVAPAAASAGDIEWARQYGTANADWALQSAATDDAVYVASTVDVNGDFTQGEATLRRYLHDGSLDWERTLAGATGLTAAYAVAADDSGVYVGGVTHASLPGQPALRGEQEAWVARYTDAGDLLWIRQFSLTSRYATGVGFLRTTATGVLVAGCIDGVCYDGTFCGPCDGGFLRLLDRDGTALWTDSIHGVIHAMDADAHGALLSVVNPGSTSSLQRIDLTGHETWHRFIDVSADGVALLPSDRYAITYWQAESTGTNGWLRAYRANGAVDWDHSVTPVAPDPRLVAIDASTNTILVSWFAPHHGDGPNATTWWASYSLTGVFGWKQFLPVSLDARPQSPRIPTPTILWSARGGYVVGSLSGEFPTETNAGANDAFIVKFVVDAAPPTLAWETLCPGDCLLPRIRLAPDEGTIDLHWHGSDKGSGIDFFTLEQSPHGAATWTEVPLDDPRARGTFVGVKPGDTLDFRLSATDKAGNRFKVGNGPTVVITLSPESRTGFVYDSSWKPATDPDADGGAVMTASDQGATASFPFTGCSVGLVTGVGPDRGKATISIDGTKVEVIDLYAPTAVTRVVTFSSQWANCTSHTLKVVVKGTVGHPRVDIDALEVLSLKP